MKRRDFFKTTAVSGLALLVTPTGLIQACSKRKIFELEEGFRVPPPSARPHTYYLFMNGHITADGITRDLEAMKRVGIGGVINFNGGIATPKGKVDFMSPEWYNLTKHAAEEADRLDLEYGMHNCPGWSSTGGPWITPEFSMQKVVWTESHIKGSRKLKMILPQPFKRLNYYRDTYVVAFPSPPGEKLAWNENLRTIRTNAGLENVKSFIDGSGVDVHPVDKNAPGFFLMEFSKPMKAQSILIDGVNITPGAEVIYPIAPIILETSDNGLDFKKIYTTNPFSSGDLGGGNFPVTEAKYYRLTIPASTRINQLRFFSSSGRLQDWLIKANYVKRSSGFRMTEPAPYLGENPRPPVEKKEAIHLEVPESSIINSASILDISNYMNGDGELNWDAPDGDWTILRMGHTTTGVTNRAAPDGGQGLEVDKYSREAFDKHFDSMFERLLPFLKPIGAKGRIGIEIDSYEVGMQNWTKDFPREFKKSRGYEIVKYLPAMTGRVIDSESVTERYLWDVRRVQADMIAENYYGQCAKRCKENGFHFYCEPYKLGPQESMLAGSKVEIVMGEFWARGQRNRHTLKLASSIQHIYGKKIVAAEAYTGHAVYSKWQQYPYAMKSQGDYMFTKGLNRIVFHTYAHQPHPDAKPGMTMGPFGTHVDRNVTWFNQGTEWMKYISRMQFLLQQGLFVADLLYFRGESAPGVELALRDTLLPVPPEGYDYDNINVEAVIDRVRIENGRIVLPDGMSYRLMLLPEENAMTLRLLHKIRDLVLQGMCILGSKPTEISGLSGFPESDSEFLKTADEIWGELDGKKITERNFGSGKIFRDDSVLSVLNKLKIPADFSFTSLSSDPAINYIHRKVNGDEIYFVANRKRRIEDLICSFRIEGKKPEFWNAATGEIIPVSIYDLASGRVNVPIKLDPSGSVFVIFRSPASAERVCSVEKDSKVILGTVAYPKQSAGRYKNLTNNFTLHAWIKPESDIAMSGMRVIRREDVSGFVFYPSIGEDNYGKGHAICGATAGLNGIVVYERSHEEINPVLEVKTSISGKTHFALVYRNGVPHVYVNGRLLGQGKLSPYVVHPCLEEEYQDSSATFFEGDRMQVALSGETMELKDIQKLSQIKPFINGEFPEVENAGNLSRPTIRLWENGTYSLKKSNGSRDLIKISGIERTIQLKGAWQIEFPENSGAPASVTIPELKSLHLNEQDGVKYFSGTSIYHKTFSMSEIDRSAGQHLFLDLGQVEVIAEVIMNDKNLGILWKRPFRIDITDIVNKGENKLEVHVTNLWPNRLIGDENLPAENEYYAKEFEGQQGGGIKKMPDWYLQCKPKPKGGRVTFTTWNHYSADSPLLESGLIGPVVIKMAVNYSV